MISFSRGGMIGRVGPFVWLNGVDACRDDYTNTIETGGFCRFGSIHWYPPSSASTDWLLNFFRLS